MLEFRQRLADFYEARQPLLDLKTRANDPYSNPWGIDELRRMSESHLPALGRARDRVAQLMVEATEIANGYNQPTELRILPPPLIGGYSHIFNIFEAAIAFDLPFDFDLRPQEVFDSVNQTVWAIEREMRVEPEKPQQKPGTTATLATKAGSAIKSGFRAVFKTETVSS